jgi:hypothetical protein
MQLSKAVAVRCVATGQVKANARHKQDQKSNSTNSSPPRRYAGNERNGHRQLGQRQDESQGIHQRNGYSEVGYTAAGTGTVEELRYSRRCEDQSDDRSGSE